MDNTLDQTINQDQYEDQNQEEYDYEYEDEDFIPEVSFTLHMWRYGLAFVIYCAIIT